MTIGLVYGKQNLQYGMKLLRKMLTTDMKAKPLELVSVLCRDVSGDLVWQEDALLAIEHLITSQLLPEFVKVRSSSLFNFLYFRLKV